MPILLPQPHNLRKLRNKYSGLVLFHVAGAEIYVIKNGKCFGDYRYSPKLGQEKNGLIS